MNNVPMMADRLKERGKLPELIIASPAQRAQSTAKKLAAGIGYDWEQVATDEMLYFQDSYGVLDVIRKTDEQLNSVMVVGHNPDMTELLNDLVGFVTNNMPTCAIATLAYEGNWRDLSFGMTELLEYDFPKKDIGLD